LLFAFHQQQTRNLGKGFETIPILLLTVDIVGFNGEMFDTMFSLFAELKSCVEPAQDEEAHLMAVALIAKLRAARGGALKKRASRRLNS
jgi:molybdopterin-guanine dinucleotide biosynthesis protein A